MYDKTYCDWCYERSKKSSRPWPSPPGKLKRRGFAFVVYDDNQGNEELHLSPTPSNWIDILADEHIHAYVIKHDQDVINETGEKKKDHWHVMIMFEGPVTCYYADQIRNLVGGIDLLPLSSIKSYARYLCHLDEPDHKFRYPIENVIQLGIHDYVDTIESAYDRTRCIDQMTRYVDECNIRSFYSLFRTARNCNREWFMCLMDNSSILDKYIKGRMYEFGVDNLERIHDEMNK